MFFPDDSVRVAALAVHLMTNTALTGATYDVDVQTSEPDHRAD